jgi:hypothetical protein
MAALLLAPDLASAGGRGSGHGSGPKSHHARGVKSVPVFSHPGRFHATSVFPVPVDPWQFWGVKTKHHPVRERPVFTPTFTPWASGVVVVNTPPAYAPAPAVPPTIVYAPTSIVYAPAATSAPSPPEPTVVEHATGRYELRGDGVTSPYQWVWIPRPPPPPPPPPEASPPEPSPPSSRAPARERAVGRLYRWTDDQGVTTWTDRLENVPERYRSGAESRPAG